MLSQLSFDPRGADSVSGVVLIREAGRFEFEEGIFVQLSPTAGDPPGVLFKGRGTFNLVPPLRVEREQLRRVFESETIRKSFRSAVLLFTDETLAELRDQGVELGSRLAPRGVDRVAEDARDYLVGDNTEDVDTELVQAFLDRGRPGSELFHAHIDPDDGGPLFYRVAYASDEEVSFGQEADGRGDRYETVSAFHRLDEYRNGQYIGSDSPRDASVDHYAIEAWIASDMRFRARADVSLETLRPGGYWTPFRLATTMTVDSARWASGTAAEYRRGEDGYALWLRVPDELGAEESATVRFWYGGSDLIDETRDWYYLTSSAFWYPRHRADRSTFDLTFHAPSRLELVSVGARVEDVQEDGVRTTRWVTEFPSVHASFNLGVMVASEIQYPQMPGIELTINEQAHRTMSMVRSRRTGAPSTNLDQVRQAIEIDIANSISFFQTWFGDPPITDLRVTEIPFNHGQAFPGMIHLSWVTYEGMGSEGYDEMFRAHEVAHQWWGLGVHPKTYHDTWLSEGFSEFAGLWYLHTVLQDPERYLDRLRETKKEILNRRDKAPPTWLGTRVLTSDGRRDYQIMVYEKGAWVLHMLRNLFLDLDTLDESRFVDMLSDFYRQFAGQETTTEDFRIHVEQHAGYELRWFFDQWIYGNAIPTYRVEYCGRENEDGTYGVTARIEQQRVPETFQMYIPVKLDFGDEGAARLRLGVVGPLTEVEFPPLPRRPDKIVFNEFESVLADVADEGWKCRDPE